jgi:hypothetical protein
MVELKKTLFFWAPLCLVLSGIATYLASDSSYVSDLERFETPTLAITTQAREKAPKGPSFLY